MESACKWPKGLPCDLVVINYNIIAFFEYNSTWHIDNEFDKDPRYTGLIGLGYDNPSEPV